MLSNDSAERALKIQHNRISPDNSHVIFLQCSKNTGWTGSISTTYFHSKSNSPQRITASRAESVLPLSLLRLPQMFHSLVSSSSPPSKPAFSVSREKSGRDNASIWEEVHIYILCMRVVYIIDHSIVGLIPLSLGEFEDFRLGLVLPDYLLANSANRNPCAKSSTPYLLFVESLEINSPSLQRSKVPTRATVLPSGPSSVSSTPFHPQ